MEKYDGIRVYWDGKGKLITSNFKTMLIPTFISRLFPEYPFEGELWFGYGTLSKCLELLDGKDHWSDPNLRIFVFDAPLDHEDYAHRLQTLKQRIHAATVS
jgi:hypothetical protein